MKLVNDQLEEKDIVTVREVCFREVRRLKMIVQWTVIVPVTGVGQVKSAIAGDGCLRPSLLSSARGLVVSNFVHDQKVPGR